MRRAVAAGLRAVQAPSVLAESSLGPLKLFDISGVDGARRLLSHSQGVALRAGMLGERGLCAVFWL